jgi:preprotein translocase subunit SecF
MMKNKIFCIAIAVIVIASLIVTATVGLRVTSRYAEGFLVRFTAEKTITSEGVSEVAKEVFGDDFFAVKELEFFDNSAQIKVRNISEEQLQNYVTKINEKFGEKLTSENYTVEHVSNVKLRTLVEPYIVPLGISTLLIAAFFAIRYKGAKQMLLFLVTIFVVEAIEYAIYALCRLPVGTYTVPIGMITYVLTTVLYTAYQERKDNSDEDDE